MIITGMSLIYVSLWFLFFFIIFIKLIFFLICDKCIDLYQNITTLIFNSISLYPYDTTCYICIRMCYSYM